MYGLYYPLFYPYWDNPQKVTFDGPNQLILINTGETEIDVQTDIYSNWKEWIQYYDYGKYLEAIRTVGGDPIDVDSGFYLGATYFLRNGWRIRPWAGNYSLLMIGNLYTDEGSSSLVPATGEANINVVQRVSNLVDLVAPSVDSSNIPELGYITSSTDQILEDTDQLISSSYVVETTLYSVTSSLETIQNDIYYVTSSLDTLQLTLNFTTASLSDVQTDVTALSASIEEHRYETENRIKYILGLSQQNFRMKDQVYDASDNMVSATVRIYPSASYAEADTNWTKQYAVSSSYTGELLTSYVMKEI